MFASEAHAHSLIGSFIAYLQNHSWVSYIEKWKT